MSNNEQYAHAVKRAKAELAEAAERGNDAIGGTWSELRHELYTPEEIAASDVRVALIMKSVKARRKRGVSQKKLKELSGVKQPIIARMETAPLCQYAI